MSNGIILLKCPQEHDYTEENTRWKKTRGGNLTRSCIQCDRDRVRARREGRPHSTRRVPERCLREHPLSGDNLRIRKRDNARICRTCEREAMMERLRSGGYRSRHLMKEYGLTPQDYDAMLQAQDGVCAACKEEPDEILRVDHDHETGENRALLCRHCNSALGFVQDSIERLQALISYLEVHDVR